MVLLAFASVGLLVGLLVGRRRAGGVRICDGGVERFAGECGGTGGWFRGGERSAGGSQAMAD